MSSLFTLSNNLASIVEQAGSAVVAVNTGKRISPSGIHWRQGIIVTSDESLQNYEDITVTLADGSNVPVTLIGQDSSTDVAVFQIQQNTDTPIANISIANIGDATTLKVGHLVLGLARSKEGDLRTAMGTVSVVTGAWRSMSGGKIDQFIRPDITLYQGFAGGSLVDAEGKVVGMNTTGRRGTALTIPASTVNRVVEQLVSKGRITRGYLGVGMQPVRLPKNLQTALNLASSNGVIIINVEPNSPADKAGVLIGDILVTFDNAPVNSVGDVLMQLNSGELAGKTVSVQIVRGGVLIEFTIVIGEKPVRE
jgi:S1-C subfamily serine protease